MNKIFIALLTLISIVVGAEKSNWTHRYTLKKDEIANITISTTESKGLDKYSLFFRWTTIVGDRVTLLLNYRGYPHQYILYKKRSLDRVKFDLLPHGSNPLEERSYLLIVLDDIAKDSKEASFNIFIKDDKNRILVKF